MQPKTDTQIEAMREGGRMLSAILDFFGREAKAGLTTQELDAMARRELTAMGGEPAFLGYDDFPAATCISVNNEVVHGIPGPRVLQEGDVVDFDFGVKFKGLNTDASRTYIIGGEQTVDARTRELVQITKQSMEAGIDRIKAGIHVGDIGHSIEELLEAHKFGVVDRLVGHAIGEEVHEEPQIPNFGSPGQGPALKAGMTVCIEPMANLGGKEITFAEDKTTVITKDGSLSAHFENTVLVTEGGYEILAG